MHIKVMYNITTSKTVFQYWTVKSNSAKLQLLLHQANMFGRIFLWRYLVLDFCWVFFFFFKLKI